MDPTSAEINIQSPLKNSIDLFACGLCKFIVQPFPLECPACNGLYCEDCVKSSPRWACQAPIKGVPCQSRLAPVKLHRDVKEVLENLQFLCPGCKQNLKYETFFEHVKDCDAIAEESKITENQLRQQVAAE